MPNDTRLPASREPIAKAGVTSRPWYRFFSNLFEFLGLGQGVIPSTSGGTGNTTYTPGDLLYADSASTWIRLSATGGCLLSDYQTLKLIDPRTSDWSGACFPWRRDPGRSSGAPVKL